MIRRTQRHFRKLFVHELEDRTTPAWVASLAGGAVSFIGDGGNDAVTFSVTSSKLSHNLSSQFGLVSQFDVESATGGEQSILVTAITNLTITGNGGTDSLTMNDVPAPATIAVESFNWNIVDVASANADITLTNSAFTVNDVPAPYLYGLSGTTGGTLNAGNFTANNVFDASTYTGGNLTISSRSGDDTIKGGSGNDSLYGGSGSDTVEGNLGNDYLGGESGDAPGTINFLRGGPGNDNINAGPGNDTIEGGDGNDSLSGQAGTDTLDGGLNDDSLNGNDGNDTLLGGDGNDTLNGQNGLDNYDGGPGNDTVNWDADAATEGGTGSDTITATNISSALITNASATFNGQSIFGFEVYGHLQGTSANDTLDGSAYTLGNLRLSGNSGDDTLRGGSGGDGLYGGVGADTVEGNLGNDYLGGESGDAPGTINFLRGGPGNDNINAGPGNDTIEGGDGNDSLSGQAGTDTLDGGLNDDSLNGNDGNDTLLGGDGNDTLNGQNGLDNYDGGPGNDTVNWDADAATEGGTGSDTITATNISSALITNASATFNGQSIFGFEVYGHLQGTSANDTLDGSAYTLGNLRLSGNSGDDTLRGGSGGDGLYGGVGADTVEGNLGNDYLGGESGDAPGTINFLRGGPGNDNINAGPGNDTIEGGDGNDSLSGQAGTDTLDGGLNDDSLNGNDGNDTLLGGDGNDTLNGQNGLDNYDGGPGNDTVNWDADAATEGGTGSDTITATNISSALITNASATFNGQSIFGFEVYGHLQGTSANDTLDGSAYTLGNLRLSGNSGDDTLRGGSGGDGLYGGVGADTVEGNLGNDYLGGESGDAPGTINFLRGGPGNDNINAGPGNDTIEGGDGNDSLSGQAGTDTLDGGLNDDSLNGNDGNDTLLGGDGNDTLNGNDGNDTLRDGPGTNTLIGGNGSDTVQIVGTAASDLLLIDLTSATINGSVTTYNDIEILTADTGDGIDEGTQVPATHPLPYTVANLEPTVSVGPDVANTDSPFVIVRNGSFKDIGSGQTWTAKVDFADGTGFQPLALNANNTFTLNHTYSVGGIFNVRVQVTDNGGIMGEDSFLLIRPAGIQVGIAGGAQRSMIDQLTVSFADERALTANKFFTFERLSPGPLPIVTATTISPVGAPTTVRFTFSGPGIDAGGPSLQDGDWRLTLNSEFILNAQNQAFDGDADGTPGGNFLNPFHRLFGDVNGDRTVDGATDFSAFGSVFGVTLVGSPFDFNADGIIEGSVDFSQFGQRFGVTLPNP